MKLLVLGASEVERLLSMSACIEAVEAALVGLSRGTAANPLRRALWLPDRVGVLGTMPAYVEGTMGVKVVSAFHGNRAFGLSSHNGVVVLFETMHGMPLAVIDAGAITAVRTAAASAVATRALATADAPQLAILGAGTQARTHIEAMMLVRRVTRIRIWNRTEAAAEELARATGERFGVETIVAPTAREAVEGANVVCTVTSSTTPVLEGLWLSRGAHVNAVGACWAQARELDSAAVAASLFFTDSRESSLNESGDLLIARSEGAIDDAYVVTEVGDVLDGRATGRRSDADITLFESLGIGVEDCAAAQVCYRAALEQGVGTSVDFGEA